MKSSSYQKWIIEGYEIFAVKGPEGLIVENIASRLGVSKSAFYHHFGDTSYFIELLLEEHFERAANMGKEARACTCIIPDFFNLVLKFKTDLLFHKQLRIHRENELFYSGFQKAARIVKNEVKNMWRVFLGNQINSETAATLLNIFEDMFYQRVTPENFNAGWLESLFNELRDIVETLIKVNTKS